MGGRAGRCDEYHHCMLRTCFVVFNGSCDWILHSNPSHEDLIITLCSLAFEPRSIVRPIFLHAASRVPTLASPSSSVHVVVPTSLGSFSFT